MQVVTEDRAMLAQLVVDLMVSDGLSLRKCCLQVGLDPARFLRAVARARQALLDKMADEILELADAPIPVLDNGGTDNGLVRHRQLRVDTRKWFLSKLAPKIYGDRLDVQVSDTRISITGALAAAQARLVDVLDVTPRLALPSAQASADDAG